MAFITVSNNVISFAEYSDVTARDQRLFEANEGLTETVIEDMLERSTTRLLYLIRDTDWWKGYYIRQSGTNVNIFTGGTISVPLPDANKIKARQDDFTDLCVSYALSEYIYPKIADFSNADNAEKYKIGLYNEKYRSMFEELINSGDWYDFDSSGTVTASEKMPTRLNIVRAR